MGMSEKDLEELLKRNPAIKVRDKKGASKSRTPSQLQSVTIAETELTDENLTTPPKKKKNKYLNKKLYEYQSGLVSESKKEEGNGRIVHTFDSVKEYERWEELRLLEKGGSITDLQRQIALVIQPAFAYRGQKIRKIEYVADFMYKKSDEIIVEDVKAFDKRKEKYRLTKDFALKWKLLKYRYPEYSFAIY